MKTKIKNSKEKRKFCSLTLAFKMAVAIAFLRGNAVELIQIQNH
jgi:hypothetical protein